MFGILICDMIGYTNKTKCSFTTPFFSAYCSEHRILDFGNSNLPKDLESLLLFLRDYLDEDDEFSIEANPETLDEEKAKILSTCHTALLANRCRNTSNLCFILWIIVIQVFFFSKIIIFWK